MMARSFVILMVSGLQLMKYKFGTQRHRFALLSMSILKIILFAPSTDTLITMFQAHSLEIR